MSSRQATAWAAGTAAVLAAFLSVGRILIVNHDALSTLVWAEDGLFPLCARAHGLLPCLVEPYSGYLLLIPRLVAWPISALPLDQWPLATNIAASLLIGLLAALTVVVLRRGGVGVIAAMIASVVPVLAPISGYEAVNVTASIYMPLLYLATLAVCLPDPDRFPTTAYALGAVVVALTIPSSAVLLIVLAVQVIRGRIPSRSGAIVGGVMVLALTLQMWAALTAESPRSLNWSVDAARGWADGVPVAFLSFLPDQVAMAPSGALTAPVVAGVGFLGIAVVVSLLVGAILLAFRSDRVLSGIGLAVAAGLLLGVMPAAAGYANNRYYVIPVLLVLASGVIAVDRLAVRGGSWIMVAVGAMIVMACLPAFKASAIRTTAEPEWHPMLEQARADCADYPDSSVLVMFSPSWPFADAEFTGPTNNRVPCRIVNLDK